MAGFASVLGLDANEIQDEMHILYYRTLLKSVKIQVVVFSVNTMMAVSPSDDSVSSDGSVFSDCSVSVMMVF